MILTYFPVWVIFLRLNIPSSTRVNETFNGPSFIKVETPGKQRQCWGVMSTTHVFVGVCYTLTHPYWDRLPWNVFYLRSTLKRVPDTDRLKTISSQHFYTKIFRDWLTFPFDHFLRTDTIQMFFLCFPSREIIPSLVPSSHSGTVHDMSYVGVSTTVVSSPKGGRSVYWKRRGNFIRQRYTKLNLWLYTRLYNTPFEILVGYKQCKDRDVVVKILLRRWLDSQTHSTRLKGVGGYDTLIFYLKPT